MKYERSLQNKLSWVVLTSSASPSELLAQGTPAVDVQIVTHEPSVTEQTEASTFLPSCKNLVSVISDLGVLDTLLIVLPKPLDPASAFLPVAHVVPPRTLDSTGHIVPIAVSHRLERKKLIDI